MAITGKRSCLPLVAAAACVGSALLGAAPAQAGKVHWKQDPAAPGCYALAFDDTDEWFATPSGAAFKRGICMGEQIRYKVVLAPDGENFTASGTNFCRYHVDEDHKITAMCSPNRPH